MIVLLSLLSSIFVSLCGSIQLDSTRSESFRREHVDLLWDPLDLDASKPDDVPLPASSSWIQKISEHPRVFIYHNFISSLEAHHLINLSIPTMKKSTVVGPGGKSVEDSYRTSYGTFLRRYQDAVVTRVENRVAAWTHLPVSHQEDIQVLRYGIGQFYKVHADTLRDDEAGVRVATVLVYLNEPSEGGETAFPSSDWISPEVQSKYGQGLSDCAKGVVGFKPKRGDALLFWSIHPNQTEDYHASHTGCPVISGIKWTITKWIHAKPFRPQEISNKDVVKAQAANILAEVKASDPGYCKDRTAHCEAMVAKKECETNREQMIATAWGQLGICRKSCGVCEDCKGEEDVACYNSNREKLGYLIHNASELAPLDISY